ncbi:glycine/D-amino acid oxidase-like deaminating enzyme [Pseudomonas nitritireducens]|uniref:Glycine/D-amino acid oxidase-like deaminating enzyme n=1 Tax=Pseudomonas nitroreducens TaxID=46680 RepID=A0A7W7KKD0_PSENT|nr:FAD-binding oxidoreductase [Pseudomonas nitritireducens]MBB4863938.1 glycine/D-amino acid oxidase-like deaminating enzyme [Pseudomonas nitritireducens]
MPMGTYPLHPALSARVDRLPEQVDVVIAGSGIMGCATAWQLAGLGLSVLVLDKAGLASQQSTRAWGFVRQQARDPAEVPLMMAAIPLWERLEKELQLPLEWRQGGCLYLAETPEQQHKYEDWLKVAGNFGLGTRLLGRAEVAQLMPALSDPALGALYTANDGQAEPRRVAPGYALRAIERGAVFVEGCGVTGIDRAAGAICGVQTERGYVKTRQLLVCAGASSWLLLQSLGLDLPQQAVRCTVSRTSPGPDVGAQSFIGHGIGFRQRADGSINLADETQADIDLNLDYLRGAKHYLPHLPEHRAGFSFKLNGALFHDLRQRLPGSERRMNGPVLGERDPQVKANTSRVFQAQTNLARAFPALRDVRVVESWAGLIDVLPDGIPVLDAPPEVPGLLIATGFCGHGFAMGPIVGQLMSQWIVDGQPGMDLHAFRLRRFADGTAGKPYSLF